MNYLVIGHLCYDEIRFSTTNEISGFGGIYYAVASLAALAGKDDTIIPLFGVGKDKRKELLEAFGAFPNIRTDGIYAFDEPTNKVTLVYDDKKERIECSEYIAAPIPWQAIQPWVKQADAILINMISGFDITYDTLYEINANRKSRTAPIYFDFHSLTLGVDERNKRFRQPLLDWRRWAFNADIVQMNQIEAKSITIEKMSDEDLAKSVLSVGPKALLITRGSNGVKLYYDQKKKIFKEEIAGINIQTQKSNAIDPTGCGDVFGAAFLYRYLNSEDLAEAARFANRVGAAKATLTGSTRIAELPHMVEELEK